MFMPLRGQLGPLRGAVKRVSTLPQGLRLWLKCDESSGTRQDSHTNDLDFTSNNSVGNATGLVHPLAANFVKASSQFLSRGTTGMTIPAGQDFSIAMWVFFNSDLALNDGLFSKGGDPNGELTLRWRSGPMRVFVGTSAGAHTVDAGNAQFTLNAWNMIYAHRRTSGGVVRAGGRANGNALAESAGITGTPNQDTTVGTRLGSSSASFFWSGRIGPFAMWDRTLTNAEIDEFYNGGAGISYPG